MKPITFCCRETIRIAADDVVARILDVEQWPDFQGYGLLPGIQRAEFEVRTAEVVGTRIRVTNTDGSSHVEQIVSWEPGVRLQMHMSEFSPPLSRLATGFDEIWEFEPQGDQTLVRRSFVLHARSPLARPALWAISKLLKRAIARHLRQMRETA